VGPAHEVEAQVDAGGRAGAGGDVAVLHVEHVGHDLDLREPAAELRLVEPVRRRLAALEQPGLGQGERTRAQRDHHRAAGDGPLQGSDELGRRLVVAAHRRHDDEVGVVQRFEAVLDQDLEALPGPDRLGPRRADGELELGHALRAAVDAEDLAGDGELERRDAVVDHDGHLLEPQRSTAAGGCHGHRNSVSRQWQKVDGR
jgi:hypothetical protein